MENKIINWLNFHPDYNKLINVEIGHLSGIKQKVDDLRVNPKG